MSTVRVRGFATYEPRGDAAEIISHCRTILDDYRQADILPITLRQMFYRLVVLYAFNKTERDYKRLGEILNRARRAGMIDMDDIRDDGFTISPQTWFDDKAHFWSFAEQEAQQFRLDRQAGQDRRILLWCEAAGMRPQLERAASKYGIRAASSGGFDSTTCKHDQARLVSNTPHLVLHIGDYDPSGVHMFGSLDQDVSAFCEAYGGDVEFVRLAVLPEHIELYDLPTAPPKKTDKRSFDDTRTVQAEAIDPLMLAGIVDEAIRQNMDMEILDNVLAEEEQIKRELQSKLDDLQPPQ